MKNKLLIITILVLMVSFGTYVYKFPPRTNDPKLPIDKENKICTDFSTYKKSKLTNGLVHDMVNIYRDNQLQSIQGSIIRPIKNDAYSIWFDLDTIKKFIYHIEKEIKSDTKYVNNKLGIRIYYAAYPDANTWKSKPEYRDISYMANDPNKVKYEKLHTLVMIPTLQNDNGKINDINLFDKNTFTNGITKYEYNQGVSYMPSTIRMKQLFALNPAPTIATSTTNSADDIAARNHGTLAPPEAITGFGF